jgi:predicted amidohydrolase YtcJ
MSKPLLKKTALIHGNVLTIEDDTKAEAVFVIGDKIAWVGSNEGIKKLIDSETEVIDLEGKTLVPGFIDCHAHPIGYGISLMNVSCSSPPMRSIRDIVNAFKEEALEKGPGQWLIGRGYDDFKLEERRHPTRWDLDPVTPENPVSIRRLCGHIMIVNSLALEQAGITKDTKDPEGGRIDRVPETGEPNGVIRGAAMAQVRGIIPPPSPENLRKAVNLMAEQFLARGVTSVSDAGVADPQNIRAYQKTIRDDSMPLRVNMMMATEIQPKLDKLGLTTGFGDDKLRIGAIKIVFDGSSSGRTAALTEPYEDVPESKGILYMSHEELHERVQAAHRAGFQVGVHAIGDRAIKGVLAAYEKVLTELPHDDHRFRIEHCGLNEPSIVARIKKLGVIPVPQPIFLFGEGESYRAGWGEERVKWAYPMRSWLDAGIAPAMSSDCPATSGEELISPLLGIYVAVTRKTDEREELGLEQRITVEEALRSYTLNGAYATFEEDIKGSIKAGKLADFAVLSEDPTDVPVDKIKDIFVEMTIIEGRTVYAKK